ncbi:DUF5703 domain-containing protein [Luteolibacter arcticus]|uniref:DUF5703 domain-containing protein n=1 Tax=Luteolibacter arcticus TaxID=1581411 RepID=A0ABT3GQC7_9BACT|nr:DUF5703 domain-containing protein [Luteolibacter arcticus]MCW1925687.1 DUF5703 domain-containing protein [Luteolibacter arcticus]
MKTTVIACFFATFALLSLTAPAAPVAWNSPGTITADSDVSTAGVPVFAYDWKGVAQSVNGVAFTAPGSGATLGWSSGTTNGSFVTDGGTAMPAYGLSAAYKNILNGGRYANTGGACTVTLNNLVDGRDYQVQIWVIDSRIYGPGRTETITSGGGNTVTLSYSNAAANTAGGMGQYATGTFTADAATQTVTLTGNSGGSTQINALQLRDVTAVLPSAPVITQQPESRAVALGDTTSLSVMATGTEPLTYQWSLDGDPIGSATAATLDLPNVTSTHAGDYTVTVTNAVNSVTSDPARVKAVDPLDPATALEVYNPVWSTPSQNDRGAMPLGNGEVGLTLWVEADGDLQFYISRTDSRTELDRLVKLGKVRLNLSPNPFASGQVFRQELRLHDGHAVITAGPPGNRVTLHVFVDSDSPTIHVAGASTAPLTVRASYETWRTQDYTGNAGDSPLGGSSFSNLYESADVVDVAAGSRLAFYHRNAWSCVARTAQIQFMSPYLADIPETLANRTFGGWMTLTGATTSGGNSLLTEAPVTGFDLKIATHTAQTPTAADWLAEVEEIHGQGPDAAAAMQRTSQWWHDYWNRSWIFVQGDGPPESIAMGRNSLPLRLGADSTGGSLFSGAMARASFYNRVLSAAEIASLATGAPDTDVTVTGGLKASWLLGSTSGGVCPGRLGTGISLTTSGTINTSTAGGVGHARFDGGHFLAADDSRLEPAEGATLETWVRLDTGEPNSGRLFDKNTANQQDGYLFDLYPGRALRFYNGFDHVGTAANLLATGTWIHVVTTYDNRTKARAVFLNGSQAAQVAGSTGDTANPTPSPVTRAYVLTKWMTACGARGNFPIMFNGSLWTVNPNTSPITLGNNPDYRNWGHTYFYQNTRLHYSSMPARGEVDFMQPFFEYYDRFQALNRGRAVAWHGAGTEGQFNNEMTTSFGLSLGGIYGYNRSGKPNWYTDNQYGGAVTISPGLELIALMLEAYDHSGDTIFLQNKIVPYAADLFRFIETRYPARADGKVVMSPIHSVETFHNTTNAMPVVAGMNAVLDRLLGLPSDVLTPSQAASFAASKALTPTLPIQQIQSTTVFAPAHAFSTSRMNVEEPEHYATFPFRLCNIGRPNRQVGIDTFERITLANNYFKPFTIGGPTYVNSFSGWQQTPMVAALLGLTGDAKLALTTNCRLYSSGYRLPSMWGQIYDSVPDGDHGGNLLDTTQLMAFQTLGDKMFLLPAWPADWDASFKFHAPRNTMVSGRYRNGTLDQLEVTPASRAKDLVLMADVPVALSGSVTVSGYEAWRLVRFPGRDLESPSLWNSAANPDHDELPNSVEYALGTDPLVFTPLPGLVPAGDDFTLTFTKGVEAAADPKVAYGIEVSDDLEEWTPVAPDLNTTTTIGHTLPGGGTRRFARLRVTLTPYAN